jgi:hypothetical protein
LAYGEIEEMIFEQWFARYLHQDESQVKLLLKDTTATKFLITWSIFEAKCFKGFAKIDMFPNFTQNLPREVDFEELKKSALYFHKRYQDERLRKNLMHRQKSEELKSILTKDFEKLSNIEIALMMLIVIYRFRNNIFHGNKGVKSWLVYKDQIILCIDAMQGFIPIEAE